LTSTPADRVVLTLSAWQRWTDPRTGTSITEPGAELASIDWAAAISALDAGELPSPGGERRMLRLAASLADQAPVSLGDAITGIDDHNVGLLVKAVLHASGQRRLP
jgi:hypothetical protein